MKNINDPVNPQHYKNGSVECIDAIEAAVTNKTGIESVCVASIIKYLWRYEQKGGLVDVKKAEWYLQRLIKVLNKKPKGAKPLDNTPTPELPTN